MSIAAIHRETLVGKGHLQSMISQLEVLLAITSDVSDKMSSLSLCPFPLIPPGTTDVLETSVRRRTVKSKSVKRKKKVRD